MSEPPPATPECEKLAIFGLEREVISEFLEWLEDNEMEIVKRELAEEMYGYRSYHTVGVPLDESLILQYLGIDPVKLDDERRALLDYQRTLNEEQDGLG